MSEPARVQPTAEPPTAEVVGYVEAVTDSAALGWTWRPGFSDRLAVELRFGEQTVARASADSLREDLARSGIGDGRHAFALPIPEEFRARSTELTVVVVGIDGSVTVLEAPPASEVRADGLAQLQRSLDMLIGSQRVMHRNLQAVLLQQPPVSNAMSEITTAQARLQEGLATLELFAVRLEQALTSREIAPAARKTSPGMAAVAAVACLAFLSSCWALWRTMAG